MYVCVSAPCKLAASLMDCTLPSCIRVFSFYIIISCHLSFIWPYAITEVNVVAPLILSFFKNNYFVGYEKELHRLLSRHLSNSFATAEEEGMGNLNRPRNWFFALIFIIFLTGSGNNLKLKESLVFKNLAKDVREAEKFRSTRQTIMCSATIPQRFVCVRVCMCVFVLCVVYVCVYVCI